MNKQKLTQEITSLDLRSDLVEFTKGKVGVFSHYHQVKTGCGKVISYCRLFWLFDEILNQELQVKKREHPCSG